MIYPNPTNGSFKIQASQPVKYKIYNTLGQVILESATANENATIDLNGYAKGIYNVLISDELNHLQTVRIILE